MPPLAQHHVAELNRLALSIPLGSFRCELLYWGVVMPGAWRNYLHGHSFVEVCYAFAGQGVFRIHDADQRVRAGDVFVARPGEAHEIRSEPHDALGICFWAHTLERAPNSAEDGAPIDRLVETFLTAPIALRPCAAALPRTLDLLSDEVGRRSPGYGRAVEGLAAKLVIESFRAVSDLPPAVEPDDRPGPGPADVVVGTIVRYLEDNYRRPISVRDVAAQVHLSERHTRRLFRRVIGVSLMDYLTAHRLRVATRLLLAGDLPIKEVAVQCGYPDVQYFSTLFHRHVGTPPGRFRQQSIPQAPGAPAGALP